MSNKNWILLADINDKEHLINLDNVKEVDRTLHPKGVNVVIRYVGQEGGDDYYITSEQWAAVVGKFSGLFR